LEAYVDSDWASQPHWHSMSGYTVFLHGAPVTWSSQEQILILWIGKCFRNIDGNM
jgi:hypothetical protein